MKTDDSIMKTDDSITTRETGLLKMIQAPFKCILPSFIESLLNPGFFKWNLFCMERTLASVSRNSEQAFPTK